MRRLDRLIRDRRIGQAIRVIPSGARVLDVGCDDGALFRRLGPALGQGVGLDPALEGPHTGERYRLEPGTFPADAPEEPGSFDVITMLAVLEHLSTDEQQAAAEAASRLLRPGGRWVLTVPSPLVDRLLEVMIRLKLLDGMDADAHHGFAPGEVEPLVVGAGFDLVVRRRFQAGLNNLFVFDRRAGSPRQLRGGDAPRAL